MANESEIKAIVDDEIVDDEPDKMTLDGAIAYYEQEAKEQIYFYSLCPWSEKQMCDGYDNCKCIKLSKEYDQLVTWLKDYKNMRDMNQNPAEQLTKVIAEHLQDTCDEDITEGLKIVGP